MQKEHEMKETHLTKQQILEATLEGSLSKEEREATHQRLDTVNQELHNGIRFIESYDKSVTFFGSARFPEDNRWYKKAQNLAHRISKELGYAVVSGGGPGIMEAANRGAHDANGKSIGITIKLPTEQKTNPYVTDEVSFHYFFTRKVILTYSAEAYLYFPGGYGTMDEFFEIMTLIQTDKIPKVPVILVGIEFWKPLDIFLKGSLLDTSGTISESDLELYTVTDDEDEIMEIIKNTPVRKNA